MKRRLLMHSRTARRAYGLWSSLAEKFLFRTGVHYCVEHNGVRNEDSSGDCDFNDHWSVGECVFVDSYAPGPWLRWRPWR